MLGEFESAWGLAFERSARAWKRRTEWKRVNTRLLHWFNGSAAMYRTNNSRCFSYSNLRNENKAQPESVSCSEQCSARTESLTRTETHLKIITYWSFSVWPQNFPTVLERFKVLSVIQAWQAVAFKEPTGLLKATYSKAIALYLCLNKRGSLKSFRESDRNTTEPTYLGLPLGLPLDLTIVS